MVTILLVSCNSNKHSYKITINDKSFTEIDTFLCKKHIGISLYNIENIYSVDNKLIVFTDSKNKFIKVFNKDFHKLDEFGDKGKANNEFIYPRISDVNKKSISIYDFGKNSIVETDFNGNILKRIKVIGNFQQCKKYDDYTYLGEEKIRNSIQLKLTNRDEPFYRFDSFESKYTNSDLYWGFLGISPTHKTIVYASQYIRSILLLNYDGSVKHLLNIEPNNHPILDNDNRISLESCVYYFGIQTLKNSFVVYDVNKTNKSLMNNQKQNTSFEEYDYDGKPIRKIVIDRFIKVFCIDNNTIYGYDLNDENSLVVFEKK